MPEPRKDRVTQTEKKEWTFPFSEQDWLATPEAVRNFLVSLVASQAAVEKRIEELEKRLRKILPIRVSHPLQMTLTRKSRRKTRRAEKRRSDEKVTGRKCSSPLKSRMSNRKHVYVEIPSTTPRPFTIPIRSLN